MFMFDIETLGIESTAVVLSAAIIHFDAEVDTDISFKELVQRGLLVKCALPIKSRDLTVP